ncbi:SRC kinase signaling inhibitor 1 isoform X4 [Esox lucius]|uniref:SRC kinase signaling inhibitor 1 isoform X4 n=1 Tax=Esox lucius TaxID=8010 RepID=UPI001476CA8E|nr:SRC kinase signaling inhibitor 1 isoform X4 [Esox lucius]
MTWSRGTEGSEMEDVEEPSANAGACFPKQDPSERGGGHMISTDDLEYPREYRTLGNGTRRFSNVGLVHTSEHRHTVIAAQSLEALTSLHKVDMERKRDAFMDHLKNKYQPQHQGHHTGHHNPPSPSPSHGSVRQPERERVAREQQQPNYWSFKVSASRSPRHSQSTQSGLADQAAKLSFASAESLAETMSEADVPLGFSRTNRFRQSLPLSRSASQNKLRSPGVLFLQFGDETRRVHITHELSSLDTLHALIVHMFPQKLTAGMLKSPNTAILIKDEARNVFYELEDVRDIQDRSVIKIYRKEPIYASYPASHLANGDLRRDLVYTSRESSPTRRLNTLPSSSASPTSSSPSRSRLSYGGGRPPSFAGPGGHPQHQQNSQHPHHPGPGSHHGGVGAPLSPSPSAILERRDVKPDEEVSGKNMMLVKNEGLYADPYSLVHEGRLSIASTQSLAAIGDPFGFPVSGGLYRRGSVRSLSTYSAAALQGELEDALYKPGGPLYSDSYSSATLGMGFRMPPSSPQKITDVQLRDRGDSYSGSPSRASPVRQTFRKDSASSSVFVESPKSRPGSSSEPLALQAGPGGDGSRFAPGYSSPLPGETSESRDRMERLDRMEAMEKQIASLTGLVQSVLTKAPDSDSTCGLLRLCMMAGCPPDHGSEFSRPFPFSSSEKTESNSDGSATGTVTPSAPLALMPPPPSGATQDSTVNRLQMQLHLQDLQQNASDLRKQLSQLRKMQLQNQDSVKTLLKRTETELNMRVSDALRKQEDPLQRQRLLVEEERLKYLNQEELVIQQLHDLEKSVEDIQKGSSVNHKLVTVQELEEKASVLRKLGETLTELKNQFPSLQSKMRVVLRVEVEAVKFLKEEPHRLDALLKRCSTVTDTLTTMRRQANEGVWKKPDDSPKHGVEDLRKSADFDAPTSPPLNLNDLRGGSSLSNWSPHSSHGHSNPSPGPHRDHYPTVPHKGRALEELASRAAADKAVSVEVRLAAERDWEEKRASLTQYSAQDINRLLEETQAELMKAIPDLDFAARQINKPSSNAPSQTPQGGGGTAEYRPGKPQHATHKFSGKEQGSRRGSEAEQLTVARYRTEKPSKSPPPPPPRRSFPSSPSGLTTRSGETLIPGKSIKKSETEEAEAPKLHVKLRRTVSENPRPASTPPTINSRDREEDDQDMMAADMELFLRASPRLSHPSPLSLPNALRSRTSVPSSLDLWPPGAPGTKQSRASLDCSVLRWEQGNSEYTDSPPLSHTQVQSMVPPVPSLSPVPRIVLTEGSSVPPTSECMARDPKVTQTQGQAVCQLQGVSKGKGPAGQPQRKPSVQKEQRIQESFENQKDPGDKEEVSLLLTELEVRLVSPSEVRELHRTKVEALQTVTVTTPPSEGGLEARLGGAPLLLLFRDTVTVREAYEQLLGLLGCKEDAGSSKSLPMPRSGRSLSNLSFSPPPMVSRISVSRHRQDTLREALSRGLETGDRILTLPRSAGTESIPAPLPRQRSAETAVRPNGSVGCVGTQGCAGQEQILWKQGGDIKRSTYRRLDSLEETIRELENTLLEISGHPNTEHPYALQLPTDALPTGAPDTAQRPATSTAETKKPPVPPKPKPSSSPSTITQGENCSSGLGKLHTSAAFRLKHLQQSSTEKTKTGKKEDFLKGQQQVLGNSSIEPLLLGTRAASFSGRLPSSSSTSAVFAPGLRKYPQEGALSSLTASSSQAKALLASLSASSLSAEALLLSSTFRQHRLLREQQRASSLNLPNGRSSSSTTNSSAASSTSTSPTTPTTSSSPSSPSPLTSLTLSSLGLKPGSRSLQFSGTNSYKERSKTTPKTISPSNSQ